MEIEKQRHREARFKNDMRRQKIEEKEWENAVKARENEMALKRRQDEMDRKTKERMDFLDAQNEAKKRLSLERRIKKEEKIAHAKELSDMNLA